MRARAVAEVPFSRQRAAGTLGRFERFLEIVPAALSWLVIVGTFALALAEPVLAALLIITFVLAWLLQMVRGNVLLLLSLMRLYAGKRTDWMERLRRLERAPDWAAELARQRDGSIRERLARGNLRRDLAGLLASGVRIPSWREVRHVVIVPVARERREIFEPGIEGIARGAFPASQILVLIAVEGWASPEVKRDAEAVCAKFRGDFLDLAVVIHPPGLPGEARVKGANATWAAREAARRLEALGVEPGNVVVSCFDADTVIHPDYFACLTWHFLICPKRDRASFQPMPVYQNNFWEVPSFARVLDMGLSFALLTEATRPERLVTFSSHSMSFLALQEVGYWPVDMVSDDSAIYWKAFLHFGGDYRVVPMYVTVSMDVIAGETVWKTAVNAYRQRRRWAWGVESFPIVVASFFRKREIPAWTRVTQGLRLLRTHLSWTTWPFLLGVMSWLPAMAISLGHSHSIVRYSEPVMLSTLFNLSLGGFVIYAVLSQIFLPREKGPLRLLKRIMHFFEWVLVPLSSLVFGALPALEAQTRLALGRQLGFWVTLKRRRSAQRPTARRSRR